jgi:hypothetical protein
MTPRTTFPTFADVPRAAWPATVRVLPPAPGVEGDVETIVCRCQRAVPACEMHDFRAIPAPARAALGLTAPFLCAACFHLDAQHGKLLLSEVAAAMGMDPRVQTALHQGESFSVEVEHYIRTTRNTHLYPR